MGSGFFSERRMRLYGSIELRSRLVRMIAGDTDLILLMASIGDKKTTWEMMGDATCAEVINVEEIHIICMDGLQVGARIRKYIFLDLESGSYPWR